MTVNSNPVIQIKERPILFSGEMVCAILSGRKTQARRVVQMPNWIKNLGGDLDKAWPDKALGVTPCLMVPCVHPDGDTSVQRLRNPWAWPEPSRLWVRERFRQVASGEIKNGYGEVRYGVAYHAGPAPIWQGSPTIIHDLREQPDSGPMQFRDTPWKPSIHMPKRFSRITLEITNVRVERAQDISDDDAYLEGISPDHIVGNSDVSIVPGAWITYSRGFAILWDQINGKKHPWSSNPWVWCISFRAI